MKLARVKAFASKYSFSPRETQMFTLLATGEDASGEYISRTLKISPNTVRIHQKNINSKLGVQTKAASLQKFIKECL